MNRHHVALEQTAKHASLNQWGEPITTAQAVWDPADGYGVVQGFDALLDTGVQLPPGLQHATRDRSAPAPLAGALQAPGFKNSADWHCAAGLTSLFGPLAEFRTQINGIARRQIVRLVVEPGRGD